MRTRTIIAVLALAIVAVACGGGGGGGEGLSGDVAGAVRLVSGEENGNWVGACAPNCAGRQDNMECVGNPDAGLADIKAGAPVTIKDPTTGELLATATLERGSLDPTGEEFDLGGLGVMVEVFDCVFPFHVNMSSASKYVVEVAAARVDAATEDGEIHATVGS